LIEFLLRVRFVFITGGKRFVRPQAMDSGGNVWLWMSDIQSDWDEDYICDAFRSKGVEIVQVKIIRDKRGKQSYGLVEFASLQAAQTAMNKMNGRPIEGAANFRLKYLEIINLLAREVIALQRNVMDLTRRLERTENDQEAELKRQNEDLIRRLEETEKTHEADLKRQNEVSERYRTKYVETVREHKTKLEKIKHEHQSQMIRINNAWERTLEERKAVPSNAGAIVAPEDEEKNILLRTLMDILYDAFGRPPSSASAKRKRGEEPTTAPTSRRHPNFRTSSSEEPVFNSDSSFRAIKDTESNKNSWVGSSNRQI